MNKKGLSGLLFWAVVFSVLALISGVFGFGLISGLSFTIAKWLAIIFIALFVISVIVHLLRDR
jgi:uncharacterized membrane protein YtjA (UPF0391 family)